MNHAATASRSVNPAREQTSWHAKALDDLRTQLKTDTTRGLTAEEARQRQAEWGLNRLEQAPPIPAWKRFFEQFQELMIGILIGAAIISGALGEWLDAWAILGIVLLNGILGFVQQERAQRALSALQQLSAPTAKVIREGRQVVLPAEQLVPGDLMELEAGDQIPTDARIVEAFGCTAQEAALTGESLPVSKTAANTLPATTPLAERENLVFLGTILAAGRATAVVVATGMNTELGHIAGMLERVAPEPTPLQKRLTELGKALMYLCLGIVAIIFALQAARGGDLLEMFIVAVSLAVAAVPEGLPAVVTVVLAVGVQRMVRRNALIRKLPSVETLGCVTEICSDKTGTLTRNEMTVQRVVLGSTIYAVTGIGYAPEGEFVAEVGTKNGNQADLTRAMTAAARCNRARLVREETSGTWQIQGDPTEGALLVAAAKAGVAWEAAAAIEHEIPFDSERKLMSVIVSDSNADRIMYTKGAPEVLLHRCNRELIAGESRPLNELRREELLQRAGTMATDALRVLALAEKHVDSASADVVEEELLFLGLVGMKDPPRPEARSAVERCHAAGIRPIMITGDHPQTAWAIAQELGIAQPGDRRLTGQELDLLSEVELLEQVGCVSVFARVTAEHKLRIVSALRAGGRVVAMTGDGVNDAAAIKTADIGIAMGITGTDVTKAAADMVLMDDNFTSIVNAVEEGRGIFDNIQKFIHYLLATNAGEVLTLFIAALVGWPVPLLAIQILWINLVTDGLPALALGMETPEPGVMQRPPRSAGESIITRGRGALILMHGMLVAAAVIAAFACLYDGTEATLAEARTAAFSTAALVQLFFSFGCRSLRRPMPELGVFSNPYLLAAIAISITLQAGAVMLPGVRVIFGVTHPLTWQWAFIIPLSLLPVTIVELLKRPSRG